jgi:hypothetical protein
MTDERTLDALLEEYVDAANRKAVLEEAITERIRALDGPKRHALWLVWGIARSELQA